MWKYHKDPPCVTTVIPNKQKCHVFLFSFFFCKIGREQKSGTGPAQGGSVPVGRVSGGEKV
jgi:hypothetical protein